MGQIKQNLDTLKTTDVYSLLMFVLYKLMDIPEYSSLSELVYIIDRKNLLKLCEYFGGTTIKIPTIEELQQLTYALLLYQYVDIDHMEYNAAIALIGHESKDLRQVKISYNKLKQVLQNYQFINRTGD